MPDDPDTPDDATPKPQPQPAPQPADEPDFGTE